MHIVIKHNGKDFKIMWLFVVLLAIVIIVVFVVKGNNSSSQKNQNIYTREKLEEMDDKEFEELLLDVANAQIFVKPNNDRVPEPWSKYGKTWEEVEQLRKLMVAIKKERGWL